MGVSSTVSSNMNSLIVLFCVASAAQAAYLPYFHHAAVVPSVAKSTITYKTAAYEPVDAATPPTLRRLSWWRRSTATTCTHPLTPTPPHTPLSCPVLPPMLPIPDLSATPSVLFPLLLPKPRPRLRLLLLRRLNLLAS